MKYLRLPFKCTVSEAEIVYLESDGNYTIIHKKSSPRKVVATSSLCHIQNSLDAISFLRINRSKVINLNYLKTTLEKKDCIEFTLRWASSLPLPEEERWPLFLIYPKQH